MIQLENVTTDSFDYASFEVMSGSRCKIITNSTREKEVLLDTLLGLRKPTGGRVFLLGKNIYSISDMEYFKIFTRVGMVWPDGRLISNLKVWENMILPACYHHRQSAEDIEEKVMALFSALKINDGNLAEFMSKAPVHLKPHEKRLTGLVRAMLTEPDLMLYDSLFEEISAGEAVVLKTLTQDFHLRKRGRVSVFISRNEQSLEDIEADMTLKQVERELRPWQS